MRGAIHPLPNTPSGSGAQLKHRYNFTLFIFVKTLYFKVVPFPSWYEKLRPK
jgi:hypothetical protein